MNSKLFLDQVPDPVTGPQRRLVPQLFRSFKQPSHQPLALLLIQQGLAARPVASGALSPSSETALAHRLTV